MKGEVGEEENDVNHFGFPLGRRVGINEANK